MFKQYLIHISFLAIDEFGLDRLGKSIQALQGNHRMDTD
jgi:hypothetical protein